MTLFLKLDFESAAICKAVKPVIGKPEVSCLVMLITWVVCTLIFFEIIKKGFTEKKLLGLMLSGIMSVLAIRAMPEELILLYQQALSIILLIIGPLVAARHIAEPGRKRIFLAVMLYVLMLAALFVI